MKGQCCFYIFTTEIAESTEGAQWFFHLMTCIVFGRRGFFCFFSSLFFDPLLAEDIDRCHDEEDRNENFPRDIELGDDKKADKDKEADRSIMKTSLEELFQGKRNSNHDHNAWPVRVDEEDDGEANQKEGRGDRFRLVCGEEGFCHVATYL